MKLAGLIRLGRDAEIRYTNDGQAVASLSAAWNYGRKAEDGKRPTQWAELSIWGDRAEKLSEWLTKGRELFVVCDDVRIETFEKRDGTSGAKLVGRVESVELTSGKADGGERQASAPAPAPRAPAPRPAPAPKSSHAFDDMDDQIPF